MTGSLRSWEERNSYLAIPGAAILKVDQLSLELGGEVLPGNTKSWKF